MATEKEKKKQPFWKRFFWKDYEITNREVGVFVGVVLVVLMVIPNVLARKDFSDFLVNRGFVFLPDFSSTGQVGDTIGGITAPFLSLLGSVLVFIAFKEQIKANKLVQDQFSLQQFETQFFEMLKLHKDNVNDIFLITRDKDQKDKSPDQYHGRMVFNEAITCIDHVYNNLEPHFHPSFDGYSYNKYFNILMSEIPFCVSTAPLHINGNTKYLLKGDVFGKKFCDCYNIFWWNEQNYEYKIANNIVVRFKLKQTLLPWQAAWHRQLGHYYRHLFYIAKFIEDSIVIKPEKKYHYFKTLRNQLSSAEQLLLFYNWCAGYGKDWENTENHFFTKYKIIHNLPVNTVIPNKFFTAKLEKLRTTAKYFGIETLFETEGG